MNRFPFEDSSAVCIITVEKVENEPKSPPPNIVIVVGWKSLARSKPKRKDEERFAESVPNHCGEDPIVESPNVIVNQHQLRKENTLQPIKNYFAKKLGLASSSKQGSF